MKDEWECVINWNNKWKLGWKDVNPVFFSNALGGECGEILNAVKHLVGGGTNKSKYSSTEEIISKILDESVDVWVYLVMLLSKLGLSYEDLSKSILHKVNVILTSRMNEPEKVGAV